MKPLDFGAPWWPEDLGHPSTTGAQNDLRYAFFPGSHRLLIDRAGDRTLYDSGDHRINGVAQQNGSGSTLSFSSQHGSVYLDELAVVDGPDQARSPAQRHGSDAQTGDRQRQTQSQSNSARGDRPAAMSAPDHPREERSAPVAAGERTVFVEEGSASGYVKVVACGSLDDDLVDALDDFVKRQRKRLAKVRAAQ